MVKTRHTGKIFLISFRRIRWKLEVLGTNRIRPRHYSSRPTPLCRAGLLSSFGELEYACSCDHPGADEPPEILDWDPSVAAVQEFPITTYQPTYFLASSLSDAKQRMRSYCEDLQRPFFALYNAQTNSVHIDRPVRRSKGAP